MGKLLAAFVLWWWPVQATIIILYAVAAFVTADPNFRHWDVGYRAMVGAGSAWFAFIWAFFVGRALCGALEDEEA